jgi:anti-sigma factor RsiW
MTRWITKLTTHLMGTCRLATEGCTDLAEGAMPEADRARVRRHLWLCPGCKAYRAQMETGMRALRELPREELGEAEKDEAVRRFRERRGK